jgi:hypothetical protein
MAHNTDDLCEGILFSAIAIFSPIENQILSIRIFELSVAAIYLPFYKCLQKLDISKMAQKTKVFVRSACYLGRIMFDSGSTQGAKTTGMTKP